MKFVTNYEENMIFIYTINVLLSIGGDFGYDNFKKKNRTDCVSCGGNNLSDWDYHIITKMMNEQGKAKGVHDIDQVDFMRQRHRDIYRGFVANRSKEWHVDNDNHLNSVDGIHDTLEGKYDIVIDDRTTE